MSTLAVSRAERPAEELGGGAYRTGRVHADFVVDGRSLWTVARQRGDLVSCLGWGTREGQDATVAELLLERSSALLGGRVPLYVCPEDGDAHCGAVTALIERIGSSVVWRDFGYETGLDLDPEVLDQDGLTDLGPFVFAWTDYEEAIRAGYGIDGFLETPKPRGPLARFLGIR
jgi:hypothetical protein